MKHCGMKWTNIEQSGMPRNGTQMTVNEKETIKPFSLLFLSLSLFIYLSLYPSHSVQFLETASISLFSFSLLVSFSIVVFFSLSYALYSSLSLSQFSFSKSFALSPSLSFSSSISLLSHPKLSHSFALFSGICHSTLLFLHTFPHSSLSLSTSLFLSLMTYSSWASFLLCISSMSRLICTSFLLAIS